MLKATLLQFFWSHKCWISSLWYSLCSLPHFIPLFCPFFFETTFHGVNSTFPLLLYYIAIWLLLSFSIFCIPEPYGSMNNPKLECNAFDKIRVPLEDDEGFTCCHGMCLCHNYFIYNGFNEVCFNMPVNIHGWLATNFPDLHLEPLICHIYDNCIPNDWTWCCFHSSSNLRGATGSFQ